MIGLVDMTPEEIAQQMRECSEELDRRSGDDLRAAYRRLTDKLEIAKAELVLVNAALVMVDRAKVMQAAATVERTLR